MGNVPAKECNRSGTSRHRTRSAPSLAPNAQLPKTQATVNSLKKKSTKQKELEKEKHALALIVKYTENVDGGYLAPIGSYALDKLDYDPKVVKKAIVDRRLAPFYIPLQDYDESWTDAELCQIVYGLQLHQQFDEEEDDIDPDAPVDPLLTKREQRRDRSRKFRVKLQRKRVEWQEAENEKFLEAKISHDKHIPNDELKLALYRNGMECPICFMYYPQPLNMSRCCLQPICTECFVQIRRHDPHSPHDEPGPGEVIPPPAENQQDPETLVSVPANCPYCATPDFGVTYDKPETVKTGFLGCLAGDFTSVNLEPARETLKNLEPKRKSSTAANDPRVVTTDFIRPDWETKLNNERIRRARKAAAATAIHASNMLIQPGYDSRRSSRSTFGSPSRDRSATASRLEDMERKMVEEAMRLSLLEQK